MNPEQREYNDLVFRIDRLSSMEAWRFFELHFIVPENNIHAAAKLVEEYRQQKEWNDRLKLTENERNYLFRVLDEKRQGIGLHRKEYKYLCFLKQKYGWKSEANAPGLPILQDISLHAFCQHFSTNRHRKNLLLGFLKFAIRCIEGYGLELFEAVIGGSFVDSKETPGDIDLALILPIDIFRRDFKNVTLNRLLVELKQSKEAEHNHGKCTLDVNKLPSGFDNDLYMVYDILTLLGCPSENRADDKLKNNQFGARVVYKIDATKDDAERVLKTIQFSVD